MTLVYEGRLKGAFKGFKNRDTIFKFNNGKQWRQNKYKYHYYYEYMPRAKVISEGGRFFLYVENMNDRVEVKRIY